MTLDRPVTPDPYDLLPTVPSFTVTSDDVTDGQPLKDDQVNAFGDTLPAAVVVRLPRGDQELHGHLLRPGRPDAERLLALGAGRPARRLHLAASRCRCGGRRPARATRSCAATTVARTAFMGAAPPEGDQVHRYYFVVHAVKEESLGVDADATPGRRLVQPGVQDRRASDHPRHLPALSSEVRRARSAPGSLARDPSLTMMQRRGQFPHAIGGPCPRLGDRSREGRERLRAKAGRGQVGQGRGRVQQQRSQPQPPARPAQLPRGLDGRVGVHRGARDRGLPGRRRDCRRTGGAAPHGPVRDPGAVAVAAGRPGPQGAGADPGLDAARYRHRRSRGRRRAVGGPTYVVYALAVLSTIATTLYRPAHSALIPSLCHTGYELASANVVRGLLDSAATLVGPLLAAVLLAVRRRDRRCSPSRRRPRSGRPSC